MPDNEREAERLDRELGELLQELRVLLPGVQVLFGFLLTVPFTPRFPQLDAGQQRLYLATLVQTAIATALLVSPGTFHRILFREHQKEWIIEVANRLALTGTLFLATAIACASFLVTDVIYGSGPAFLIAGGLAVLFMLVWYVVPLVRRARN